jgi:hypothetical protein
MRKAEIKEFCLDNIKTHQEIIDTHSVAPFEYHKGNIKAYQEVLEFIKNTTTKNKAKRGQR